MEAPLNDLRQAWKDLATRTMQQNDDVVAVITMVVERSGVIRPMASTNGMPDTFGETLRAAVTEFLCNVCSFAFKRPFRCGCRTCETDGAKELRDALQAGTTWNQTKGEA